MRSLPSELARQLYVAAELGHRQGVVECLAKGADPNAAQARAGGRAVELPGCPSGGFGCSPASVAAVGC